MGHSDFLYQGFRSHLRYDPTPCQDNFLRLVSEFVGRDDDIMVVNGYAGTGKTTAISAVINTLNELKIKTVLLAPTGRAAKVLSNYSGRPAAPYTSTSIVRNLSAETVTDSFRSLLTRTRTRFSLSMRCRS